MAELFNVYCDESCHLEHDGISVMVLGALWCVAERSGGIAARLREIKRKHGLAVGFEMKWTKVSPAKQDFYLDVVDYFFDDDDLHFRGIIIPDKGKLDHVKFQQDHDSWYYKMLFRLLEVIVDPSQRYRIYLDIKDTKSEEKRRRLEEVLRTSRHDSAGRIIDRVQQIRSNESELMQLSDLLIGAVCYRNRDLETSLAKLAVIRRIQRRSNKTLAATTWLRESKMNLLQWQAGEV